MSDYQSFLSSKRITAPTTGIDVPADAINPHLKDFQSALTRWALRKGRAALFADCGLGKSLIQLEWARHVCQHTGGDVLILAPLTVAAQTAREGAKFGIPVTRCRTQADAQPGINVTNYEMLQHFDPDHFAGVVLDESSILRNYSGTTRKRLTASFADTPYRLCCTATPAPNDHTEIGQHSEFLGIMPANEMLSRWFINDTMAFGTWRLKGHAEQSFWDWVATWAISMRRPSDLGYSDEGYILPPLNWREITVEVDRTTDAGEHLFRMPVMSATEIHQEMRRTAPQRAAAVAEIVNASTETWAVWCNTNYEADELTRLIPDAVEIRGSESPAAKESKLTAFVEGRARVLVTKPTVAGYGVNLQHCHHTAFVGLSYSMEQLYQAVRRFWRFGQAHPVEAVIVTADTEDQVLATVKRKLADHERQFAAMNRSANKLQLTDGLSLEGYDARVPMQLPSWLREVAA